MIVCGMSFTPVIEIVFSLKLRNDMRKLWYFFSFHLHPCQSPLIGLNETDCSKSIVIAFNVFESHSFLLLCERILLKYAYRQTAGTATIN